MKVVQVTKVQVPADHFKGRFVRSDFTKGLFNISEKFIVLLFAGLILSCTRWWSVDDIDVNLFTVDNTVDRNMFIHFNLVKSNKGMIVAYIE